MYSSLQATAAFRFPNAIANVSLNFAWINPTSRQNSNKHILISLFESNQIVYTHPAFSNTSLFIPFKSQLLIFSYQNQYQMIEKKWQCTFKQFSEYCRSLAESLNEDPSFLCRYVVRPGKFITEHDAEYLEMVYNKEDVSIKMNLVYNLAFGIADFLFMIYEDGKPLDSGRTYEKMKQWSQSEVEVLRPGMENGIILNQNHITGNTFFTLHACQLKHHINYLIPYYLSLLGLHPVIDISNPSI